MLPRRSVVPLAALVACCPIAAACGSGDAAGPPTRLVIETRDLGPDRVSLRAPATATAGIAKIELRNRGDTLHDAQLFRLDGDHGGNDVVGVLENSDNSPKPRWMHPAGGVAPTAPGESASVTQVLQPGTYWAIDTQERTSGLINAAKRGMARIEVRGETGDELPPTAATITAREYDFETRGIAAGTQRVTFRNAGREIHQVVAFPVPAGMSFREGRRAMIEREGDTGWVPVDAPHERATTVLEGGGAQVTELTFDPGKYLLLCFVTDQAGGAPHWMYGMTSKLEVRREAAGPSR